MAPKAQLPFEFDRSELEDINKVLHLTMHRNKNQHRLAKWWKSFQMLRRNLAKLLLDLEDCTKTQTKRSRAAVEDRAGFILEALMPKCYRSFGAVVADNQYATLGLMLMGLLARLNKIIMPLQREPEVVVPVVVQKQVSVIEDMGEPVTREAQENIELQLGLKSNGQAEEERGKSKKRGAKVAEPPSQSMDNTPAKPPKKKRKKGNAIDDLFSGIL